MDFERQHVDSNYQTIVFDWQEIETPENLTIQTTWNLDQFEGFFNSWSAVQNFKEKYETNPVDEFMAQVKELWTEPVYQITFPIFMRAGTK